MFGIDEADAETDIYRWIRKCGAIDKLVKGLEGSEATRAVNHLLSYRNVGQKVEISIISKFVAMELSKKFKGKFLAEAKSHSISFVNPSWNGWVFQIDFFMQLRRAFEKKEDLVLHGSQKKSRGSQSFEVNPNEKNHMEGSKPSRIQRCQRFPRSNGCGRSNQRIRECQINQRW